jgi:hypothetical protein
MVSLFTNHKKMVLSFKEATAESFGKELKTEMLIQQNYLTALDYPNMLHWKPS